MEDTEQQPVEEQPTSTVEELIKQMDELKENTVSKDDYNKLKQDNTALIRRLAEERPAVEKTIETPTQEERYKKLQDNSRRLMSEDLNGYEYAQLLIENEDIEKELGIDPFGADDEQSVSLKARNDATSKVLRETLNECKDRPDLFSRILDSKLAEDRR